MDAAEAFRTLRADPRYAQLMRDSYMTDDERGDAERYAASAEFAEVERLLHPRGKVVVDLGAGRGISSFALARAGAVRVYAVEPDPSEVGRAGLERVCAGLPVEPLDAVGEELPLPDGSADAVHARQVLHHARDLGRMLLECGRVLRPGGILLASREHVVDDGEQLERFLAAHPVHRLAANECAYPLERYVRAFASAGLELTCVLGPWDSVLNAFPAETTRRGLARRRRTLAREALRGKLGRAGGGVARVPGVPALVARRVELDRTPGRLYAFVACRPSTRS